MSDPVERVAGALAKPEEARWFRAPGRVNLMGDHTDYNDGLVLPMAIDREAVIAAHPRSDGRVRVRSLDERPGRNVVEIAADGEDEPSGVSPGWGRYVAGVMRALAELGRRPVGLEAVLASSVPPGGGLSSSAALEVACALALADAAGSILSPHELARACQRAEQLATSVRSGIMDQLCSLAGREGAALRIDCRTLDVRPIPMPATVSVIVVHSGVRRSLEASAYGDRRAACEALAARLGVPALRDATAAQVRGDPLGRHVVSEIARVDQTVDALQHRDFARLGALLSESQRSLRDDFCVSTPELDALCEALEDAGALGARLTGAGFGGCVVALADVEAAAGVAERAADGYRSQTGLQPSVFRPRAAAGAGPAQPPSGD